MSGQKTVLITGSSRGIGLALVNEYIGRGWRVLATCRTPARATELTDLLSRHKQPAAIALDVSDDKSIGTALQHVQQAGVTQLNVLYNNAGVLDTSGGRIGTVSRAELDTMFSTNVSGQVVVTQTFLPLLKQAGNAKVVFMSSIMASLTNNMGGQMTGYRTTKCALNMITRMFAGDAAGGGLTYVAMHPGWVQTDMGNSVGAAPLSPADSCRAMADTVDRVGAGQNGCFIDYQGRPVQW